MIQTCLKCGQLYDGGICKSCYLKEHDEIKTYYEDKYKQ